jgi:N,N'-diacetyllegionaminate synthase
MEMVELAAGADHAASLEPAEFRAYAALARDESALRAWTAARVGPREDPRWGPPEKRVLEIEGDVRRVSRQSITAARELRAGEVVQPQDVTFKRPGSGLEPFRIDDVVGRRLARDVAIDMPLAGADIEGWAP